MARMLQARTRWAIWRWSRLSTRELERLHLFKTPWFAVAIHWINGPSVISDLHDHPATFLSIVLKGWYVEFRQHEYPMPWPRRLIKWFNYVEASYWDCHRIEAVAPFGCVTLCLEGPKIREWGFHTPNGWVPWREYLVK